MTKLNDMQLILLTSAAQRESGSVLPAPASVADAGDRLKKAIASLRKRSLVEEAPAKTAEATWQTDGDERIGLFINAAGRSAINIEPGPAEAPDTSVVETPVAQATKPKRETKSGALAALLQRPEGATLAEMVGATGWQPHTTRAALTGLRKKGFSIEKAKRGDETCYSIPTKA
jgi:hypothetical protein